MTNLIERITDAIIRQEGMPLDFHNPGNLRDCPWFLLSGAPGYHGRVYPDGSHVEFTAQVQNRFWVPRTRAEGIAGSAHIVALHIAKGESLTQLITIWAPPQDKNDTASYIKNVKAWASIPDENVPLWNFIDDPKTT